MKPLVSVIMSVYNSEKYLSEAIESILNQTYRNFEFIIINDGSTDKSLEIIKNYAQQDSKIFLISRGNRGLVASLNEGMKKARGKYIVRMDADDISLSARIEKQVEFMETNPDIVLCGTAAIVFDDKIQKKWKVFEDEKMIKAELLFSSPFIHPSIIMRKDLILKYNLFYNKKFLHTEDLELWNRISNYGLKMANINEILFKYRNTPNSVTKNADKYETKRFNMISFIFKKNLKLLHIDNTEKENNLHFNLTVNHRIRNIDNKEILFNYFEKIINANRTVQIYDENSLKKILGRKWLWYIYYKKDFTALFNKYFLYGLIGFKK